MLKLVRDEALAYLRLGLSSGQKSRIAEMGPGPAVLFVPGVGANGAHFFPMKDALQAAGLARFEAFEYNSFRAPEHLADELRTRLDILLEDADVLLIGHSLGGVLACLTLLRTRTPPPGLRALVTLGSPLHGTWRSKLAPVPALRALTPDSELMVKLSSGYAQLGAPLLARTLNVGARRDQMVQPARSAFIDGARHLELDGVAHTGLMFDARALHAVAALAQEVVEASESAKN